MALLDLFSTRMKRQRGEVPDVYAYDRLPLKLRHQIIHIWRATLGSGDGYSITELHYGRQDWEKITEFLRRKKGKPVLASAGRGFQFNTEDGEVATYFLQEGDVEEALDVVEVVIGRIHRALQRGLTYARDGRTLSPTEAIEEINSCFNMQGIGYQFESGQLIRVDSQVLHAEVVRPALSLLRETGFDGPNEEFLRAHEHHRQGRQEECLVDCLKAFESTMKVICEQQKWAYDKQKDTAAKLVGIIFEKGLLPDHVQSEFTALRSVLESGVPVVRNKNAGHGAGGTPRQVPGYLAAYALHLTAANIVFLVEAHKASSKT